MSPKYSPEMIAEAATREWSKPYWLGMYAPGDVHAFGHFPRVDMHRIPQSLLVLERAPSEVDDLRAEEWI